MNFLDNMSVVIEAMGAVGYSLEGELLSAADNDGEAAKRALSLFYILVEKFNALSEEFDQLAGHIRVYSAIYATNRIQELKDEIEQLKAQKAE